MRIRRSEQFLGHLLLVVGALLALLPFLSIVLLALTPSGERTGGGGLPSSLTLENFATAWTRGGFGQALWSSLVVAVAVVLGASLVSVLAGYAFSTMRFPGRFLLLGILLVGLVMPYEGIIVPLYYLLEGMGLLNTYWALILPQIATSVSLGVLWMRTAYANVPRSLGEAASIDGAGRWATLWRVYMPVSAPAIATLGTLLFLYTWNEFLMALVLVPQNPDVQTAPLALSFFAGSTRNFDPSVTAAAAVIVALPILVVYAIFQRRFITGVVAGAVKE
ncbi:carbohydrate ABC transporter permease [Agromyces sp. NPDC060279]|uniref:carbohydrate ABC transporter permease n=1 Tax=Agromyces sp. NPDC060279 TaxID=3347092 RepID=UPI00364B1954